MVLQIFALKPMQKLFFKYSSLSYQSMDLLCNYSLSEQSRELVCKYSLSNQNRDCFANIHYHAISFFIFFFFFANIQSGQVRAEASFVIYSLSDQNRDLLCKYTPSGQNITCFPSIHYHTKAGTCFTNNHYQIRAGTCFEIFTISSVQGLVLRLTDQIRDLLCKCTPSDQSITRFANIHYQTKAGLALQINTIRPKHYLFCKYSLSDQSKDLFCKYSLLDQSRESFSKIFIIRPKQGLVLQIITIRPEQGLVLQIVVIHG